MSVAKDRTGLLADFGLWETEHAVFLGVLLFVFKSRDTLGAGHDGALGGQVAFGLE